MQLHEAIYSYYGCAVCYPVTKDVVHVVEHSHDDIMLLTVRRGVSILHCQIEQEEAILARREYQGIEWTPARTVYVEHKTIVLETKAHE